MTGITGKLRVALVTGAAQGIGRAIALQLARDGLDVALNDLQNNLEKLNMVANEIRGMKRRSSVHVADVSKEEEVKNMVAQVVETHGALHVVRTQVYRIGQLEKESVEEFDRVFSVNVRGTFLCYKYAAKQMIAQGEGGRIIGASSLGGKRGSAHLSTYSSTKFAVRGLTQTASKEFGPYGITVNAYAPGAIETDMLEYLEESNAKFVPGTSVRKSMAQASPLGINGEPDDVSGLVSYLVSEKARFITGQTASSMIVINFGQSLKLFFPHRLT
uniref:Putative acetoin reductase family protein n=1 Tax=Moniliophthora roreri TaxID=221103 RepID=A0A0W0EY61_MONRR